MKHFGDITKLSGYDLPVVDVITGGSPCQDLSVAGKRAGLAGERSGLFMEQLRIVKEMRASDSQRGRNGINVRPRYMVWENVPGAFSSGNPKGADFASVIEEIIKVAEPGAAVSVCVPNGGWTKSGCYYAEDGSWSVAWRVHDAQFWGVPQRRKRIALVADFGGLSAPEILFERKGVSGDSEPCGETGQETTGAAGGGAEGASCYGLDHVMLSGGTTYQGRGYYDNVSGCLKTQPHGVCSIGEASGVVSKGNGECFLTKEKHTSLSSGGGCAGQGYPCVLQFGVDVYNQELTSEVAASLTAASGGTNTSGPKVLSCGFKPRQGVQARSLGFEQEMSPTINTDQNYAVLCLNDQGGSVMGVSEDVTGALRAEEHGHQPVVYENHSQDSRFRPLGDICQTVSATYGMGGNNQPLVVSDAVRVGNGQLNQMSMAEQANTLDTMHDQQAAMVPDVAHALKAKANCDFRADSETYPVQNSIVRRLTPLECERLQGYPDGWTSLNPISDMSDEDYAFWQNVLFEKNVRSGRIRQNEEGVWEIWSVKKIADPDDGDEEEDEWENTHKPYKHKTRKQMIAWYNRSFAGDSDSPRYKTLGNSIALPFWFWLLRRISAQYERPATLGSLFDGIGGFPLCWERCNGMGTAIWASEIEEFPIAVTKKRFNRE